jgi:hypothetical protein
MMFVEVWRETVCIEGMNKRIKGTIRAVGKERDIMT